MIRRVVVIVSAMLVGVASSAWAEDSPSEPTTNASPERSEPERPFTLVANPLALILGRYSADFSWLPAPHVALVVNANYVNVSPTCTGNADGRCNNRFDGFGGEIGYRLYSGRKGANGLFAGPSAIFGTYRAHAMSGQVTPYALYGFAFDIGAQTILDDGLTIGGGVGVEYTHVGHDFNAGASWGELEFRPAPVAFGGWLPRFLFTAGRSF